MFLRALSLAAMLVAGLSSLAAAEAYRPDGTWTGTIILQPAELEIDTQVVLRRAEDGTFTGTVSYPATQGDEEHALEGIRSEGQQLEFSSRDQRGTVSLFRATFSEGGERLEGELLESGQRAPFTLERSLSPRKEGSAPNLGELDSQASVLRSRFNQDSDKVRLLMILSPTCGVCRMGARLVQRYVADAITDPRLKIYVVWEAISPRDTLEEAQKASWVLSDGRVESFWSPGKAASLAFKDLVGVKKTTAWDVFLVFDQGRSWGDGVPRYDFFMHNLKGLPELPEDRLLNAKTLAREIESLLQKPGAAASPTR